MKKSEKIAVTAGAAVLVPTVALIAFILITSITGKELKWNPGKTPASQEGGPESENGSLSPNGEVLPGGDTGEASLYTGADTANQEELFTGLDAAKYDLIKTGMTYQEVTSALGIEGTDISGGGIASVTVYQWFASDGSGNAMVSFLDNQAIGKTRTGEANAGGIDKALYERVQPGMTYEELTAAAGGGGLLLADSSVLGEGTKLYAWVSADGITNAVVSFVSGKVSEKRQFGLE